MTATTEFVVPRSMPMTLPMLSPSDAESGGFVRLPGGTGRAIDVPALELEIPPD
jgi:hypothetical protein